MMTASDKYPWGNSRRINTASDYLKRKFGGRVQKLTIDAGFTCPNRDGTKSTGGCHFCNNDAFNPSYCSPSLPIEVQISEGKKFHEKRYRRAVSYLAYFQAYSNTHGSLDHLRKLYDKALEQEGVQGIIIATRPDCIDEQKLDYLALISEKHYVVVEYGIETIYNDTLARINRGHTFEDSVRALELTAKYGIKSGAHFIFGLPGESGEAMLNSVKTISSLPLQTIKLHQLQIIKGTKFALDFESSPEKFNLFSLNEYTDFIIRFISMLNPAFIIERLAAETQPWINVKEMWDLRYDRVLRIIEERMESTDMWQGKYFPGRN